MLRRISLVAAAVAIAGATLTPAATASVEASCEAGRFCWFQFDNFGGAVTSYRSTNPGQCYGIGGAGYTRSYINNTGVQGYFYASKDCSGSPGGVMLPNKQATDTGVYAYTFRDACVTCKS
ncbi:peptidase inhibitor family I36 protein [Amycolatopsis sp. cg5]|uniref:peptidase inhibitor family I36 protein n=1 Tax=Amycolatopsis sp. cg5 TaxID=3238802 RepID=UPI0035267743